jgi:hypothetical protein
LGFSTLHIQIFFEFRWDETKLRRWTIHWQIGSVTISRSLL